MVDFTLRKYQSKVISETYSLIRNGSRKILLFAPTGAGKTIISTKIVSDAVSRGKKVLFVVHREILVKQTFNKFNAAELRCGFIKAGWQEDINAPVQIASVQTLPKREEWKQQKFDVIVFDECHLVAFSTICQQMMASIFPHSIYLGLTATPWRLSKKEALGDIYSALVCAPMPKELIEAGFLVKPSYYCLNFDVDLDGVELTNGDYNPNQLSASCDLLELREQICSSWFDLAYNRSTIAFAINVAHAQNIAKAFNNHGIKADVVSGSTPIKKRNELYEKLAEGKIKVIASCDALSEGFDVPAVSCVILARPTKSKALYFQQLGRGLRLNEGKTDCLVLDQSQNVLEHGFIEDLTEIELKPSEAKRDHGKERQAPLKICPPDNNGCGSYVYASSRKCPHCQYNFDTEKLITVLGRDRLIVEQDRGKLEFYRNKLREAFEKRFAPSWAAMKFKDEFGFMPPFDWGRGAVFNFQPDSKAMYLNYLQLVAKRLQKDSLWVNNYLYLEFGKRF